MKLFDFLKKILLFLSIALHVAIFVSRDDYISFATMILMVLSCITMLIPGIKDYHHYLLILCSVVDIIYFIMEIVIIICEASSVYFYILLGKY